MPINSGSSSLVEVSGARIEVRVPGVAGSQLQIPGFASLPQPFAAPHLIGRVQETSNLVPIPLAPGLEIVNGVLTLAGAGTGSVTSVGVSVPLGFNVADSPVTSSGTLAISYAAGYSLPAIVKQNQWDLAYQDLGLARTPTAHKSNHATGGSDALAAADIGAAAAVHGHTIANVTGLSGALAQKADLVGGVLPTSQLPALAITSYLGAVANQAALLALTGERGDWAIRLDRNSVWILSADAPSLLTSWVELPIPTGVVLQVNNQTGVITLGPGDVGAEPAGTTAAALAAHLGAANPHGQYELKTALGGAAYRNVGTAAGTVAAGDDARFEAFLNELSERLRQFRDVQTYYVSKSIYASDNNNGTSLREPFLTGEAAIAAARAYVAANPGALAKVQFRPGRYIGTQLPWRTGPDVYVRGAGQRSCTLTAGPGQELKEFFALDSGAMVEGFTLTGLQALGTDQIDLSIGQRGYGFALDGSANNGQGVYLMKSPYVKDCTVLCAAQGDGTAGSTSVGMTGGAWFVDAARCRPDSPIRSMLAYGLTAICLNGPGFFVRGAGAYSDLVSCFGVFCSSHVQAQDGGEVTMSGGGVSQFGTYGIVADGYSTTPIFSGYLRVGAIAGAVSIDVIGLTSSTIGQSNRPVEGHLFLLAGNRYVIQSSTPIDANGNVVQESSANRVGYKVQFFNETGAGLLAGAAQGANVDFRARSKVIAGPHTAQFVGAGCNYLALPQNGGRPIRGREFVERNGGKVYGTFTNEVGDFSAGGGVFKINGITGEATIDGSKLNLSNLLAIGPFSRNGGLSTVGVQLRELSNNTTLLNSLGLVGQDTAPTQFAVRGYIDPLLAQLAPLNSPTFTGSVSGITKAMVGLGNVDNISDQNKPISAATAAALAGKADLVGGLVPSSQLPGFVDDVIEFANLAAFPASGEAGKLYIALNTNKQYRWAGSSYQEINPSPGSTDAIPEGSVNLYHTSGRAAAAAPVQSVAGRTGAVSLNKADVGLGNVDNISDQNKPISAATAAALAGKADLVGGVIPSSQIPSIAISDYLGTASSQSAMLSLSGQRGDWAIRTDRSRAWILSGDNASQIGNWVELPTPVDVITSVNGQVGVVVLGPSDIGAAPLAHNQEWGTITNTPTTLSGYGITDGLTSAVAASTYQLLSANLTALGANNVAYYLSRSNHTGTQLWSTITGMPTTLSGYGITDAISSTTTRSANLFLAGPTSGAAAAPTFRALVPADLPSSLHSLEQSLTAVSGTYTLDISGATYFRAAASIAGNTTINITNLSSLPSGRIQHYLFIFSYSSGALTLSAPAGYTFARSGVVPSSAGTYAAVITASGSSTVLLVNWGSAYS